MSIPFTQFLLPDGRRRHTEIEMPPGIERLAEEFIKAGGWFECEMLTTGHISLTACWNIPDDGPNDIAIRVVPNGPPVVDAVAALVLEAVAYAKKSEPA